MKYKLYDIIIEGCKCLDIFEVYECAHGFDWQDIGYEIVDHLPYYHQYKDHINGLDIYYDYGADYYFFVEEVEEPGDLREFTSA